MNWIAIGLAAGAGALAALVAGAVIRTPKQRKTAYTLVFVVVFAVLNVLAKQYLLPVLGADYEAGRAEHALLEIPAFQAMKQYDPSTFQAVMNDLKEGLKRGTPESELTAKVKTHVENLVQKRLPLASDQAVVTYMGVMVRAIWEFTRQDPNLCYKFLFPQQYGAINPQKYLPKELLEADFAGLAQVIKTSAENPQPLPKEADVSSDMKVAFAELYEQHGEQALLLQNPHGPAANKGAVCGMMAELYEHVLALPPERGSRLLRFLLSQT